MKPRDLLPIVERVRRATTNRDVLTVCDALSARLSDEMKPRSADDLVMREMAKFAESIEVDPVTVAEMAGGVIFRKNGKRVDPRDVFLDVKPVEDEYLAGKTATQIIVDDPHMPRTAMDAVVAEAEGGRKPARGKAKRAIARKAAKKGMRK